MRTRKQLEDLIEYHEGELEDLWDELEGLDAIEDELFTLDGRGPNDGVPE